MKIGTTNARIASGLKTFLSTAAVIIVCKVAFGFLGAAQNVANTTPSTASIHAAARAEAIKVCAMDGRLAATFATERDEGLSKEENSEQINSAGVSQTRAERVHRILDNVYANAQATSEEMQSSTANECMQQVTMANT